MKLAGFAFKGRGIFLVTLLLMTLVAGGAALLDPDIVARKAL